MYYLERSTGVKNLIGITNIDLLENNNNSNNVNISNSRHIGYGYITTTQEEEVVKAKKEASNYLNGYLENIL